MALTDLGGQGWLRWLRGLRLEKRLKGGWKLKEGASLGLLYPNTDEAEKIWGTTEGTT